MTTKLIKPFLDLTQTHFTRVKGDITIYGAWCGDDRRPCLALVPTIRYGLARFHPCIVHIDDAWKWNWRKGDGDPAYCAKASKVFARYLGLNEHSARDCAKVVVAIQDHIGDLFTIPPKPTEAFVAADAIVTNLDTGKQKHAEILDHV